MKFGYGLIAYVVVACLAAVSPSVALAATPGNLGTNLAGITYYDGVVPFNDLVRQGGDWVSNQEGAPWGAGPRLALRPDGWPAQLASGQSAATPIADVEYPAGTYSVSWRGTGTFRVAGTTFSGTQGTGTVHLDGSSLVVLEITSTSVTNPLRAIRVVVPGANPASVFRTGYVRQLAPYRVLRFMDWQRTNGTFADPVPAQTCTTRVRAGFYSQGTRTGASVEFMVRLANRTGAAPWFTIPHTASRSWIRCHARYVAANLRSDLVPRYEYSNETWNPAFEQFHDLTDAATAHGLGNGDSYLGLQQEVARRHRAAMDLVSAEFAARSRPVIRVMAGQAANAFVVDQRLAFEQTAKTVDQIAIAPYMHMPGANAFDPTDAQTIAAMSLDDIFAELNRAIDDEVTPWVSDHVALAHAYDKQLVAYEGGQHLAGDPDNDALTDLFVSANRDPRMGTLYDRYLTQWRTLTGNRLFVHFTDVGPYTRYGSWGTIESSHSNPAASAKYQALLRFRAGM